MRYFKGLKKVNPVIMRSWRSFFIVSWFPTNKLYTCEKNSWDTFRYYVTLFILILGHLNTWCTKRYDTIPEYCYLRIKSYQNHSYYSYTKIFNISVDAKSSPSHLPDANIKNKSIFWLPVLNTKQTPCHTIT